MRTNICWGLCAASVAAIIILDGGRGFVPFLAVDSFAAVSVAAVVAALWRRFDPNRDSLSHAAHAALAAGALATVVNAAITMMSETDAVMMAQRLALGLTGLLYGAASAAVMQSLARPNGPVSVDAAV